MRRGGIFLIFLACIAVILGVAGLGGWFSENKPDHPEIKVPATAWKTKQKFIDQCLKSPTTIDSAKGNANQELQLCTCLADKVEAKYPDGLSYQEASMDTTIKTLGADLCYK